jgi:hypothetical protein
MARLWQDMRYGLRMLVKAPGASLLIVLTLALGMSGSTLGFNMVRQWVLKRCHFP